LQNIKLFFFKSNICYSKNHTAKEGSFEKLLKEPMSDKIITNGQSPYNTTIAKLAV